MIFTSALFPRLPEFAIKDFVSTGKIELPFRDRYHDDFAAHDLPLHMRIFLAGAIMLVLGGRRVRDQFLKPELVIVYTLDSATEEI